MNNTSIEWTDATWNPIRGCSRVSEGCRNCYAEKVAYRFSGLGQPYEGLVRVNAAGERKPEWNGQIRFVDKHLLDPLKWKEPRRIFVNSMSDLFHENVRLDDLEKIWRTMCSALNNGHTFQILTKRPERMKVTVPVLMNRIFGYHWRMPDGIWLGVSVENQKTADERIPLLLQTPAAVRFISAEPLLGPIDFEAVPPVNSETLDWVIVGGESGPGSRPFNTEWAESIVAQCKAAGVACFVKQLGGHVIQSGERRIKKDKKGGDMHEWPHEIRVREFPKVSA